MACETFLKIAEKCKVKFVSLQPPDRPGSQLFIHELLVNLQRENRQSHTLDLEPHQIHMFYEARPRI